MTPSPNESFSEHCAQQQRQLDQTLADVEYLCGHESYVPAALRFGELRHQLELHLEAEERITLPLFIQHTSDPQGVVPQMREQHERLMQLVSAIARAISRWDRAGFAARVSELRAALEIHHLDEERLLHAPLVQVLRTAADWRGLCFKAGVSP